MRLRVITTSLILLATFVVATPGRAEAKQKLAVLGVEAEDGSESTADTTANLARWLTQGMRARAGKASKYEVPASANKDLAEMKLLSDCLDEKPECMAQMGKDLGVERMIFGKLSRTKQGWNVSLKLINIQTRSVDGKTWEKQFAAGDATEEGMKKIATAAFADLTGTVAAGSIEVEANVDSGTVYIDGNQKGVIAAHAASIPDLPDGSYTVAVESEGHKRWEKNVSVKAGEPTLVVAQLEATTIGDGDGGGPDVGGGPGGEPPGGSDQGSHARPGGVSRGLFWTSLVVTAGGVAAFTVTGLKVRDYEQDKRDAILSTGLNAGPDMDACAAAGSNAAYKDVKSACDDGKRMATVTNVLIGVTAVAAVAAGYFYYKGYVAADKASRDQTDARRNKKKRSVRAARAGSVTVTPQIYGNGAGLGAVITF
jgi:hypothetical protein